MLGELTRPEIDEVLHNNYIGRIGCRDADRIYIMPVNYIYEDGAVLCQSYEGLKVSLMRKFPGVCFEVEAVHAFNDWKTVLAWGIFEELVSPADITHAFEQLSEVMLAQKAGLTNASPAEAVSTRTAAAPAIVYYRIRFDELSGRFEKGL